MRVESNRIQTEEDQHHDPAKKTGSKSGKDEAKLFTGLNVVATLIMAVVMFVPMFRHDLPVEVYLLLGAGAVGWIMNLLSMKVADMWKELNEWSMELLDKAVKELEDS